jgi:hypothetical protein
VHRGQALRDAAGATADVALTPVYVRADGDGWEVVDRESGSTTSTHEKIEEALAAARPLLGAVDRAPHFKVHGEAVGVFRWLDASAEEAPAADSDGTPRPYIDRDAIEVVAARLNAAGTPSPIDGGELEGFTRSVVHGTARSSSTPANGWAHAAVPVEHSDGRLHLMLESELLPDIAKDVDLGRLAYGSVHVEYDLEATAAAGGALRDPELASHALTNRPANRVLMPSTALREQSTGRAVLRAAPTRNTMDQKKAAPKAREIVVRGPALDKLTLLASELGVTITDELSDEYMSPICERVRSLRQLAIGEQVLEGLPSAGGDPAAAVRAAHERHRASVQRADPPAPAAPAAPAAPSEGGATDPQAELEALKTQIEALKAENAALRAERDAMAGEAEDPAETAAKEAAQRESAAKAAVTRALEAGRIHPAAQDKYIELCRAVGVEKFEAMTKDLRAVPRGQLRRSGEERPRASSALVNEDDPRVQSMRAAGLSTERIAKALAKRTKAEV